MNKAASLILAGVTLLALAGCSGGGGDTAAPAYTPKASSTSQPTTTPTAEPRVYDSVVSLGDSMSVGYNACEKVGPCKDAAWSTGSDPAVNSVATRLAAATGNPVEATVFGVAGSKAADMPKQAAQAVASNPALVTMLVGANDACNRTLESMTSVEAFTAGVQQALTTLSNGLPTTTIYVGTVPNLANLYEVGKNDARAVAAWNGSTACASLLTTTDTPADGAARRTAVTDRVNGYNAALGSLCAATANCIFDNGATNALSYDLTNMSTIDFFHSNATGQAKIAEAAWTVLQPTIAP